MTYLKNGVLATSETQVKKEQVASVTSSKSKLIQQSNQLSTAM